MECTRISHDPISQSSETLDREYKWKGEKNGT